MPKIFHRLKGNATQMQMFKQLWIRFCFCVLMIIFFIHHLQNFKVNSGKEKDRNKKIFLFGLNFFLDMKIQFYWDNPNIKDLFIFI